MANLAHGLVSLPLLATLTTDSLLYVIRHTTMRCLIGHPGPLLELARVLPKDTSLRLVVVVPHFARLLAAAKEADTALAALPGLLPPHVAVTSFDKVCAEGTPEDRLRPVRVRPKEELATLSCTSGSTVSCALACNYLTSLLLTSLLNRDNC